MTPIASMVLEMIARKVDPEVIALAVQAAEEVLMMSVRPQMSRDESVTNRRENDRLRKQRSRDRLVTNREVTGQSQDASLSKRESLEKREAESVTSRDTWRPPEPEWNDAVAKLGLQTAESELVKFRERPGSMPRILPDWRVWVQRAVDWQAKNKPPPVAPTKMDAVFDWESVVKLYTKTGRWSSQAGPDPESSACRCPREILEKHALLAMRAAE